MIGFLLKVGYDSYMERLWAGQEFQAAALLVSDELQANVVTLEIAIQTAEDPELLASKAYDTYQMILARRLPPAARDAVRGAYIHARVPRAFQVRDQGGRRVVFMLVVCRRHSKNPRSLADCSARTSRRELPRSE